MGLNGKIELRCVLHKEATVICITRGFRKEFGQTRLFRRVTGSWFVRIINEWCGLST